MPDKTNYKLISYDKRERKDFHDDYRSFHNLSIGDIVSVVAYNRNLENKDKFYGEVYQIQITKIDRYKCGGVDKIRKFHGFVLYITAILNFYLEEYQEIIFRADNILKIDYTKNTNTNLKQNNTNEIVKFAKEQRYKHNKLVDNTIDSYLYRLCI